MRSGERRLRETLDAKSDVMSGSSLDFDAMRRQAKGIRRRRRVGTGVAAAAVLAIIAVPTVSLLGDVGSDDSLPADHDKVLTEDKGGPDPMRHAKVALDNLESFPRGEDPQVDYVEDGEYRTPDGATLDLPETEDGLSSATFYQGGAFLATDYTAAAGADVTLRRYDARGEQVSAEPGSARFAVSSDGTRLAWWTWDRAAKEGTLHLGGVSGMGNGTQTMSTGNAYVTPVGLLSGSEVVHNWVPQAGDPQVLVSSVGSEPREIDGLSLATGVQSEDGLVAGQTSKTNEAAVVDATSGEALWHKPDLMLGTFSPDGKYVLGFSMTSPEPVPISILDARTGEVVQTFDLASQGLGYNAEETIWEDDDSLLLDGYVFAGTDRDPHQAALVRLDADGGVERASEVDDATAWLLAPRP